MSTTAVRIKPAAGSPAGNVAVRVAATVIVLALAALALRFFVRDALKYVHVDPATFGDFWPRRVPLTLHVAAGSLALFIGPLQFWTGLRRIAPAVHRWTGRVYLACILVGVAMALYLAWKTSGGWTFGLPLAVTATIWAAATGTALAYIRARDVRRHRAWMVRSYALTFFFVFIRGLYDVPGFEQLGTESQVAAVSAWLSLAISLAAAEIAIRMLFRRRRTAPV
jgi:predicted membrane protein DUF2306